MSQAEEPHTLGSNHLVRSPEHSHRSKDNVLPEQCNASTQMSQTFKSEDDMANTYSRLFHVSRWPCTEPLYHETYLMANQRLKHLVEHYRRLDHVVGLTDCSAPRSHINVRVKLKKLMLEGERLAKQEQVNRHMMREILRVMKGPGMVEHYHTGHVKGLFNTLNYVERRRNVHKINMENKMMLRRILETGTCYDHIKMELDYQRMVKNNKPRRLLLMKWNRLRPERKFRILRGTMLEERVVMDPEEIRIRFLEAHRRCFPSWPQPIQPRPIPRSSSPPPGHVPVDHTRCFAVAPMLPPVSLHPRGTMPHAQRDLAIHETKAHMLRTQCILEKIESMKPKPFYTKNPHPPMYRPKRDENQSACLPHIQSTTTASHPLKKSPAPLAKLAPIQTSTGDSEASFLKMSDLSEMGVIETVGESKFSARSAKSQNTNNSESGPAPGQEKDALGASRSQSPIKLPPVLLQEESSSTGLVDISTPEPLKLPPVMIPSADCIKSSSEKGLTSPASSGGSSPSTRLKAVIDKRVTEGEQNRESPYPMDITSGEETHRPVGHLRKVKGRKRSVKKKKSAASIGDSSFSTVKDKKRHKVKKKVSDTVSAGTASSQTRKASVFRESCFSAPVMRSRVCDDIQRPTLCRKTKPETKESPPVQKSSKHGVIEGSSPKPRHTEKSPSDSRHSRQRAHVKSPLWRNKQKTPCPELSVEHDPSTSSPTSRKSSKFDPKSSLSTVVAGVEAQARLTSPAAQYRLTSTGTQSWNKQKDTESSNKPDKDSSVKSTSRRSSQPLKSSNRSPSRDGGIRSSPVRKHGMTSDTQSVTSRLSRERGGFTSLSRRSSKQEAMQKEIMSSPSQKRRVTKKRTRGPRIEKNHTGFAVSARDEVSPAYYPASTEASPKKYNNISTGASPSKYNSNNNTSSGAVPSTNRSPSPNSEQSSPRIGQGDEVDSPLSSPECGTSVDRVCCAGKPAILDIGTEVDEVASLQRSNLNSAVTELRFAEKTSERAALAETDDIMHGVDIFSLGDVSTTEWWKPTPKRESAKALDDDDSEPVKPPAEGIGGNSGEGDVAAGDHVDVASPDLESQPTPKRKHGQVRFSPLRAQVLRDFTEDADDDYSSRSAVDFHSEPDKEQIHQKAPDEVEEEEGLQQGDDDDRKEDTEDEIKTEHENEQTADFDDDDRPLSQDYGVTRGLARQAEVATLHKMYTKGTKLEEDDNTDDDVDNLSCSSSSSASDVLSSVEIVEQSPSNISLPGDRAVGDSEDDAFAVACSLAVGSASATSLSDSGAQSDEELSEADSLSSESVSNTSVAGSVEEEEEAGVSDKLSLHSLQRQNVQVEFSVMGKNNDADVDVSDRDYDGDNDEKTKTAGVCKDSEVGKSNDDAEKDNEQRCESDDFSDTADTEPEASKVETVDVVPLVTADSAEEMSNREDIDIVSPATATCLENTTYMKDGEGAPKYDKKLQCPKLLSPRKGAHKSPCASPLQSPLKLSTMAAGSLQLVPNTDFDELSRADEEGYNVPIEEEESEESRYVEDFYS